MKDMIGHFVRLLHFSGRERVGSFWPYAGVVLALMMVASAALFVPEMTRTMERMQQFAVDHPEAATVTQGPGQYEIRIEGNHPELMPDLGHLMGGMVAMMVVAIALLAAAVARRLHDSGRSGAWGLLPLPFLFSGFALMRPLFAAPSQGSMPGFGPILLLFANNVVYIGTLVLLIYLLSRPGEGGENRFGPPPA